MAGSLPLHIKDDIADSRKEILANIERQKREPRKDELNLLEELHFQELDAASLDQGNKFLGDDRIAAMVADALRHFDGTRYQLLAWAIMPNHVHVVLQTLNNWDISDILHSWKSFTANTANQLLQRNGAFWQKEGYDHLIRNQEDLERCIEYVWENPKKAGLKNWKWHWKMNQKFSEI